MNIRAVVIAASLLFSTIFPASARNIATGPFAMYVDNNGNDANSGLTPALPKQHICAALTEMSYNWDFAGNQPFLYATSGQQFNEMCGVGGTLVGANEIQIYPSGVANFVWTCSPTATAPLSPCGSPSAPQPQWCIAFGDLAIVIFGNITFADCNHYNMVGGGAVVMHNLAIGDFFNTGTIFSGSGNKDTAILCDGPCVFTVAAGATFEGQYHYGIQCNRGCNGTVSGLVALLASNLGGIYGMYSGSHLNLAASYSVTSSSVGPSLSAGFSNIITNGTAIAGSTATANGGQFCGSMC